MAAGLLVMPSFLLAEIDHVATRELGRDATLSAVDDIRHWLRRGRIVVPETAQDHLGPHSPCAPATAAWTWRMR
nr:hypothetical protein [Streptomyces xiaopingdaonensis]